MKQEELHNYIRELINNTELNPDILKEIPNVSLALLAYKCGLERKDFPDYYLIEEVDIEKEIPAEYHILIGQGAILKSKTEDSGRTRQYLTGTIIHQLRRFRQYFLKSNPNLN